MFGQVITKDNATELLLPTHKFKPYPVISEREMWSSLPEAVSSSWISWGEERLSFEWPALPAVRYMDFAYNGNRTKYEELYFERRRALIELVFAECIEGKGRFMDAIINGIWCLCEESYWVIPAHMYLTKSSGAALPDVTEQVIDLFAAETGAQLAWTAYLLEPKLEEASPMIIRRIRHEMQRRIFEPYLNREDFWWMGYTSKKVNNWNPWIHSNCLAAFLLLEEDEEARNRAVAKAAHSLDTFMEVYHPDGGCDEGPGYWGRAGASLYDCLELLYLASDGKINFYGEPLVQEIGKYIYRAHIDGNDFVNFADGDARLLISGDLVYRYGQRIGDSKMSQLGAYAFQRNGFTRDKISSPMRIVGELLNAEAHLASPVEAPYEMDVWLPDIQVFAAREQPGSPAGLYVAAKGGHNDESHNHNDIGHFIVYYNGHPFLIDAGVESYTAKTFSPQRYELWTMQSGYHSLPTVNGVQQHEGASFRATEVEYEADDAMAAVSMNIATAYPPEAGIRTWQRSVSLIRGKDEAAAVEVTDSYLLAAETRDIVLNVLTLQEPELKQDGCIELTNEYGEKLQLYYDSDRLRGSVELVPVNDSKMQPIWGTKVYRLQLQSLEATAEGTFTLRVRPM